ncbi:MAG: threonine synthase [Cyclobacteriaceae bacterium]
MKFYSTNNSSHKVSFRDAIFNSLPSDNGLYYPEKIPALQSSFIANLRSKSKEEVALEIAKNFIGDEIPKEDLKKIIEETVNFEFPLVEVENGICALELFHGPTWAFKDLGARFLSRCMRHFIYKSGEVIHILVATSGDTGGAVAAGFHGIGGINVTILYPKGKVSELQKKQLTTWGGNIRALEVDGTFDDCQKLVKTAFLDQDLNKKLSLSSANSINIARLIPQTFYYFFAFQQLVSWEKVVVSVPSGNYGNLSAGLFAKKMGLPVSRFIAASNTNKVVPDYLATGVYQPKPSIETYANAMDVGAPSNFTRMLEYFEGNVENMRLLISGFSLLDAEILATMRDCKKMNGYVLDPHGAIGYQALKGEMRNNETGIFLETAHPVKFINVLEKAFEELPDYGSKSNVWKNKQSDFQTISNSYDAFHAYLINE